MESMRTREELVDRLFKGYEPYFDVERYDEEREDGLPLKGHCRFYVHSEKYVLIKKAKLWDADSNEFVYVFSVPELTAEIFEKCKDYAYEEGMKLVQPKPGHMYSYITVVFICDTCTPEGEKALKKCKIYKSFHFSWYGWINVHTAAIVREGEKVFTNHMGRSNAKFMKNILNS